MASVFELVPAERATTWLFAPGHDERKMEKGFSSLRRGDCQRLILDWEDAVPPEEKERARVLTCGLLERASVQERRAVVVRVHEAESDAFDLDLEALEGWLVGAVMLAKAECRLQVQRCATFELPIIALIETALGVEQAFEVARADPWVRGLALGPLDFFADLRAPWSAASPLLEAARVRLALAARAAALGQLLLGPYPDLDDLDGLASDTRSGRDLGYTGRLVLHPRQIEPVKSAFAPDAQDIAYAREVLSAWRQQGERGVLTVGGRFVDRPVVLWAERLLRSEGNPGGA